MMARISSEKLLLLLIFLSFGYSLVNVPLRRVKVNQEVEIIRRKLSELKGITQRLQNIDDSMYLGQIQVGKMKQTFDVIFDTGSSYVWFPSTECQVCPQIGLTQTYNCTEEDGCSTSQDNKTLMYGTCTISGYVSEFQIGVSSSNQIDYKGLLLNNAHGTPANGFQGLVGMTPEYHIQGESHPNLVMSMFENKVIEKPLLSVFSAFEADELLGKQTSEMIFGGYDESKIQGKIEYFNISEENTWSIPLMKFQLDNKTTIFDQQSSVLIDTGSSDFYMRPDISEKFIAEVRSRGIKVGKNYEVDCNADLNVLNFSFQNAKNQTVQFDVEPAFYLTKDDDICHAYLIGAIGGPTVVLGHTFIRKYLPIFDFQQKQIGLARTINQGQNFQLKTEQY